MDIRQLRYFVRIVELGSLSRAAKQLYVAQPALSQQIAKLEEDVGKPLLVRSSKGVTPTDNGRALYHHACLILRQVDQAMSIAQAEHTTIQGMVSVGLPATTVAAIGLPLIQRVRERFPSILINVVEAMSGHISQLIRQNQLDLAVLFAADLAEDLTVEPLMVEELFLFLPKHSTLVPADRTSVCLEEVAALPLILPTSNHGLRKRIAIEFESRAMHINTVAEIDSLALLMNCVYENIGATIKPMGAIMQEGQRGRDWRCLPISDAQLRRSNFLYSLPPETSTTAATVVAGELKETVRELIENPAWRGFEPTPQDKKQASFAA